MIRQRYCFDVQSFQRTDVEGIVTAANDFKNYLLENGYEPVTRIHAHVTAKRCKVSFFTKLDEKAFPVAIPEKGRERINLGLVALAYGELFLNRKNYRVVVKAPGLEVCTRHDGVHASKLQRNLAAYIDAHKKRLGPAQPLMMPFPDVESLETRTLAAEKLDGPALINEVKEFSAQAKAAILAKKDLEAMLGAQVDYLKKLEVTVSRYERELIKRDTEISRLSAENEQLKQTSATR